MKQFDSEMDPGRWVDAYGDDLYRFALARLRNAAQAEDAVQETLLAALKARDGFAGKSTVRTWLFSILKHKIIDQIRRDCKEDAVRATAERTALDDLFEKGGHYKASPQPWRTDPRTSAERREFWQHLEDCLSKGQKRLAQIFSLRELDGLDRDEICKIMEISPSNYWVMLHRARLALRACLERNWG